MTETITPTPIADPTTSPMRFWGWGVDGHDKPLPEAAAALLSGELGPFTPGAPPPASEDEIAIPASALGENAQAALAAVVGDAHVRVDHVSRVRRAVGRSYPDLLRLRQRRIDAAPDAVVAPGSPEEVQRVLEVCASEDVAVVPFGGGTSVVGGVEALRGDHAAVIALDLTRLDAIVDADPTTQLATLQAGLYGPDAEAKLRALGLTLGHFPQSFEFSTVGGWVATRSAGQASTGNGRIDELVRGVRLASPAGEVRTLVVPATAAGPDLRELIVGSEGTLGVITEATVRVRPVPAVVHDAAFALPGFAAGAEAFRELEQSGWAPTVARLSDEEETRFSLGMAGSIGGHLQTYLKLRGQDRPCLAILGFEGDPDRIREARRQAARIVKRHGGIALPGKVGAAWRAGRFHGPYLRDAFLTDGIFVDTLETATTWSNLLELYRGVGAAIRSALADRGTPALVGTHISHLYPTGASLYFSFLARMEHGAELAQWQAAKDAAGDAIAAAGATITHHHAVGTDHATWLAPEVGPLGADLLRAAKATLDPTGIMNPGKLLLPASPA